MYKIVFIICSFWQTHVWAEKFVIASQDFNYYPHYNFKAQTDKGMIWALLEEFGAYHGHEFIYRKMPVLRLQRELEKGTVDLVYPDNPLFNKKTTFAKRKYYSDTIVTTLSGTMVKNSNLGHDIHDVKRLSIPLGFTPQLGWEHLTESLNIILIPVVTPSATLKLLTMGRVDAAEVDYYVSQHQSHLNPELNELVFDPSLPHSTVEFRLSTINQSGLIDDINQFISSQPEILQKLKIKYGIEDAELVLQKLKKIRLPQ